MTPSIDYHGWTLDDALQDARGIIDRFRKAKHSGDVEFITGRGAIRVELFRLLELYKLSPSYKLGNDGVIVCLIE